MTAKKEKRTSMTSGYLISLECISATLQPLPLILLKRGGQMIYSGQLGPNSRNLIEYFERIPGVPKIQDNNNPATWMLEVTSAEKEEQLGTDFAQVFKESSLYLENKALVEELSIPPTGISDLHFPTQFSQNRWFQVKACFWKLFSSYWRSSTYNTVRLIFTTVVSVMFAALFWQKGMNLNHDSDLISVMGSMYQALIFIGIMNCSGVLPMVAQERAVLYREWSSGMYSCFAYSLAQVAIEIPCQLFLAAVYVASVTLGC